MIIKTSRFFSLRYVIALFLLLISAISNAGTTQCSGAREGIFKIRSIDGSLHTIVRNGDIQMETSANTGNIIQCQINWTSNCTFILYNRILLRGSDSLQYDLAFDTLYNTITETNNSWETITSRYCDTSFVTTFFKIDTAKMYKNLSDLDEFKEYKGGNSWGTLSGYNYVITCFQHPVDKSKYMLAFEEALLIGKTTKYKLLDHVFCTLDSNLKITTRNCRYDDMYDKEIVAIYYSPGEKDEAFIIKSWRFDKAFLKIKEVPTQKVKYKVADKYLTIWKEQ